MNRYPKRPAARALLTLATATVFLTAQPSSARADSTDDQTASTVNAAVSSVDASPSGQITSPSVQAHTPATSADPSATMTVEVEDHQGSPVTREVSVELPVDSGGATTATDPHTRVYGAAIPDSTVALQTFADGMRVAIVIESGAPQRYEFPLGGDAFEIDIDDETGDAVVLDANSNVLLVIPAPWAVADDGQEMNT